MEMMRQAEGDHVHVVPGEKRAMVGVPVGRAKLLGRAPRPCLVDVGDGGQLDALIAKVPRGDRMVRQDPSRPDDAVADSLERRRSPCGRSALTARAAPSL
jgi:hypothetical protein